MSYVHCRKSVLLYLPPVFALLLFLNLPWLSLAAPNDEQSGVLPGPLELDNEVGRGTMDARRDDDDTNSSQQVESPEGSELEDAGQNEHDEGELEPGYYYPEYQLPYHLRRVIPGTDVDYYDYIIQQEILARDVPTPTDGDGLLPGEDFQEEEYVVDPDNKELQGNFVMCHAANADEILTRCRKATKYGTGVYIQMIGMDDFARSTDYEDGNPAVQNPRLSEDHYKTARFELDSEWFSNIRQLKRETKLSVGGVWLGPLDFDKMDRILRNNPKTFDGILLDWSGGEGACVSQLRSPPRFTRRGSSTVWSNAQKFFMRVLVNEEDPKVCKMSNGLDSKFDRYISNRRDLRIPFGWTPIFSCFRGSEGGCYKAFSRHAEYACKDSQQRYAFNKFERWSESMMLLLIDTCAAIDGSRPKYDLVMAI